MWHELTEDNLANAIERAYDENPKVRQVRPGLISVPCSSGMHAAGHLVECERRADGTLWGRCWVSRTEGCPAELSRRPCWHLAVAAPLFVGIEAMKLAADPEGVVEHAVTFDGAMPAPFRSDVRFVGRAVVPEGDPDAVLVAPPRKKVERVRGFQI